MRESDVVEAVDRWFRREHGAGYYCGECVMPNGRRADLVYVQRADVIHGVEAKARASDVDQAFLQLDRYRANYKWLALPNEEYERYSGIASACSERGYGLLLVSGRLRYSVEPRRKPRYLRGRFDEYWPQIFG